MAISLSAIWKAIKSFGATVYKIAAIALPIIKALRQSSTEVDAVCDRIDAAVLKGEVAADDFFDRNLDTLRSIKEIAADSVALFHELGALCDDAITFSQVDTPDQITPAEAQKLAQRLDTIRVLAKRVATKGEPLEKALAEMK